MIVRVRGGGCSVSKHVADDAGTRISPGLPPDGEAQVAADGPNAECALERYTEPASIWEALATGHVKLVKMRWLIAYYEAGGVLPRRQDLPPEAFISLEELKRMYGDGNRDGVLPIIAVSFCWETPAHPDPHGKQLATVAAMLKKDKPKYAQANDSFDGFADMGVFWVRALSALSPTLSCGAYAHCTRSPLVLLRIG